MAFSPHAPPAPILTSCKALGAAVLVLALWLAGCSGIDSFDHAPAVQGHHVFGVPHVADGGTVSTVPDGRPTRIQRVLYHALAGRHHGRDYDLEDVRRAGFTAVHPWEGQDLTQFLEAAQAEGLGVVPHYPDDAIAGRAEVYGILAWYLDEEPVLRFPEDRQPALRNVFRQRRDELRAVDPARPVFTLLGPPLDRLRPQWDQWAVEGDLSAHDNYAVNEQLTAFTTPARHVARSVSFARSLIPEDRPIWFVIQAFSSEDRGWTMPSAEEYRAMAMAALIHGASGIVTFALDSFVTRDDHVLGIAPDPVAAYGASLPDYNGDGKPHRVANDEELAQSAALWQAVADFNRFLDRVGPTLLLPNRTGLLTVSAPPSAGLSHPVRVVVKQDGDGIHVYALNLLTESIEAEFRLTEGGAVVLESSYPYGPQQKRNLPNGVWRETMEPLGVRAFRISHE